MARLTTIGWEVETSPKAGVEFVTVTEGSSLIFEGSISTSDGTMTPHGGDRYGWCSSTSGTPTYFRTSIPSSSSVVFLRFYMAITGTPEDQNKFLVIKNSTGLSSPLIYLTISNGRALRLFDEDGQIGSASSVLTRATWHRIEVKIDLSAGSGSHIIEAKLNGTVFATASDRSLSQSAIQHFYLGNNLGSESHNGYSNFFDDLAINDNSGSYQTSYPGTGYVGIMRPNANGDFNNLGGGYSDVNDNPPDDGGTTISSNGDAVNSTSDYELSSSGISAGDGVNVVHANFRAKGGGTSNDSAVIRLKASSGGTVLESAELQPIDTTYRTNVVSGNSASGHIITSYTNPDNGLQWTSSSLNSAQIGWRKTVDRSNGFVMTAEWVTFEWVPAAETTTTTSTSSSTSESTSTSSTSTSVSVTTSTSSTSSSSSTSTTVSTSTSVSTSSTSTSVSVTTSTSSSISISTSSTSSSTSTSQSTSTTTTVTAFVKPVATIHPFQPRGR